MESLIKSETGIQANVYTIALADKKIKECTDKELAETISACVEKAWFDLGLKRPDSKDDMAMLKLSIMNECKNLFSTLTRKEINNAFHFGCRGKYGEVFGLTVIQVSRWLSSYMMDVMRQDAQKQLIKQSEAKAEPTKAEKFQIAKEMTIKGFESFKVHKDAGLMAASIYAFLRSISVMAGDYGKGIMQEAIERAIEDREREIANCIILTTRRQLNNRLECLRDNIAKDMITEEQKAEITRTAKKMALHNFFQDCIMNEENLGELIDKSN